MAWKEMDVVNQRTGFVLRSLDPTEVFAELCEEYGISRKTGYKWRKRFYEEGVRGLYDQSRRPKRSPNEVSEEVVCRLIRTKLGHKTWGPKKIRDLCLHEYGEVPSLTSVKRILDRAGLVEHRKRRRRNESGRIADRVIAKKSNAVWTVDFKGWWKLAGGQRCEPLTLRDEYSRYVLALRALESSGTDVVQEEFRYVFRQYGLPESIRSDNGSPFASSQAPLGLSRLSAWWVGLGIRLDRIEPGHPEQNGGHERLHRDIRKELQGMIEGGRASHQAAFDIWRKEFNEERPHEALGMKRPADVYERSERRYEECEMEIGYPVNYLERKVSSSGEISLWKRQIFLTSSLAGWNIGLKPCNDDQLDVYFDYLRLGEIDLRTMAFRPAVKTGCSCSIEDKVLPMS